MSPEWVNHQFATLSLGSRCGTKSNTRRWAIWKRICFQTSRGFASNLCQTLRELYSGIHPASLTRSKAFGLGQESGQFLPKGIINGLVLFGPMLSGMTGIWFDDRHGNCG
jgi:hypothetical protein